MTLAVASVALVLVAVSACGNSLEPPAFRSEPEHRDDDAKRGSPTLPSPSPAAINGFGPLAVIRPEDGADTAVTEGTLRVTKRCVFLRTASERELLVWPADRTTWDPRTEQIGFTNYDGTMVRVGDGSRVRVGGGGSSNAEDDTSSQEWLSQMPWVNRPASSCPLKTRWFVGDARDAS